MNLLVFSEYGFAINIDRIDGLCVDKHDKNITSIYVGGSEEPWKVNKPLDEVLMLIRERSR